MNSRAFFGTAFVVFMIVAIVHMARIVNMWHAQIGEWEVPIWLNWVAFFFIGALAVWSFRLSRRAGRQ